MLNAELIVFPRNDEGGFDPLPTLWGDFRWTTTPAAGETIGLYYNETMNWLRVISVEHFPLDRRYSESNKESALPRLNILAEWIGHKQPEPW